MIERIDWVSERCGDGAGYDILSFETNKVARFIEVKTTNGGSLTPFVVSRNDVEFSEEAEDAFCLYRVFDFAGTLGLFIIRGAISQSLHLEAMDYRARLKAVTAWLPTSNLFHRPVLLALCAGLTCGTGWCAEHACEEMQPAT